MHLGVLMSPRILFIPIFYIKNDLFIGYLFFAGLIIASALTSGQEV